MKIKIKPKPKLRLKESWEKKQIVLKKIKTSCELSFNIDDVSFKNKITFDANYQVNTPLKQRISSFKFSATKKF